MVLLFGAGLAPLRAWSPQGHRLVALVAAARLTPLARRNVAWLLDGRSLADVAVWADEHVAEERRTGAWHYVNIPRAASGYDRERECPSAPGAADRWRECAVDRILFNEAQLANASLDRGARATALKFLVHLVGDLHQPLHAIDVARGGNDTPVVVFGSATCAYGDGATYPCNLHGVWDTTQIARRRMNDRRYLVELSRRIGRGRWDQRAGGTPEQWAAESHRLAAPAMVSAGAAIDDAYVRAFSPTADERLALGGLRLARLLNRVLATPPPR
jgi:hypothetical protein